MCLRKQVSPLSSGKKSQALNRETQKSCCRVHTTFSLFLPRRSESTPQQLRWRRPLLPRCGSQRICISTVAVAVAITLRTHSVYTSTNHARQEGSHTGMIHVCLYACIHAVMQVDLSPGAYCREASRTTSYVYTYACTHVCMHVCMYVCTNVMLCNVM